MALNKNDFENTVRMLDACNAAALASDLSAIIPRIWEEAQAHGKGTSWVANHPIMILWISKIMELQNGISAPYEKWTMAYNYCLMRANRTWVGKIWSTEGEYGQ